MVLNEEIDPQCSSYESSTSKKVAKNYNLSRISIVLATHNEFGNLPFLVKEIEENVNIPYELIFVDDDSRDGTREFIIDYSHNHENVKKIFSDKKRGTAIARYRGILAASNEYIIIMDSDNQHPPSMINEIVKYLEQGYDFVVCSRYLPDGSTGNRMPIRGLISRVAATISKSLLHSARRVSDPLSNFIGFTSKLSIPLVFWKGYEIPLCILSSNPQSKIKELPYTFRERENGISSVTSEYTFFITFLKELIIYKKIEWAIARKYKAPVLADSD